MVDEFGGASGIVTLKDVLEEIVGDIGDDLSSASEESEEEAEFERVSPDEFIADGAVYLHDLAEMSELDLEGDDVSTLGGYVSQQLGHLPLVGERFELEGYEVETLSADDRLVGKLRFCRIAVDEENDEAE